MSRRVDLRVVSRWTVGGQCRVVVKDAQVHDDIGVDVPFNSGVSVAHHVVPHAAVAALGHQGLPARAAKRVLALLGAELDDAVEEGQVEAPHLDPRAARGRRDGRIIMLDLLAVVLVEVIEMEVARRRDDGLNGRQRLGQASREEQLGGLPVRFGNLRRLLPAGRQAADGRAEVARPADVFVDGHLFLSFCLSIYLLSPRRQMHRVDGQHIPLRCHNTTSAAQPSPLARPLA